MINDDNTRLDQFIKESLNSQEIPFNEADWADMENRLNSRPSSNSFRKWSFSMNATIGLVAVGALTFGAVYTFSGNSSPKNIPAVEQPKNNTVQAPVQNTSTISTSGTGLQVTGTEDNGTAVTTPVVTNTGFSFTTTPNTQKDRKSVV